MLIYSVNQENLIQLNGAVLEDTFIFQKVYI